MRLRVLGLAGLLFVLSVTFAAKPTNPELDKKIEDASEYFQYEEFDKALEIYLELYSKDSSNADFAYRIGVCYIHSNHNEKALKYLLEASEKNFQPDGPHVIEYDPYHRKYYSLDLDFNLGRAFHLHHEFDKAIKYYNIVKSRVDEKFHGHKHDEAIEAIEHFKQMAENGKKLTKTPIAGVKIENLGADVNSEYEEIAPIISADESTLIFTSRRPNTTGGAVADDGKFMEDIYICTKVDGKWSKPRKISDNVNTSEQDAAVALTPDGHSLIVYKNNHHGTGDLYQSNLVGELWTTPEILESGINTRHWENSASISADEKTMIFTSTRPHGFGGEDLYIVRKGLDGEWKEPENMGDHINTKYDEDAPFLMADGRTLYFSSRGHSSMGGFDIFKSTYNKKTKTWSKPENVGYPINSADDDIFFVWSPDGQRAYFSSHHEDGYGDQDLYVMYIPQDKVEEVSTVMLTGRVSDETGKGIDAEIKVTDNETGELISTFHPNKRTGKYTVVLPTGSNYGVSIEHKDFIPYSKNVNIPEGNYEEKIHDVMLKKLEAGSIVALRNVFFEKDSDELMKESFHELDKYSQLLQVNKDIKVEIAGHTDADGDVNYNLDLSQRRAQSVVNYLTNQGVKKDRLHPVGYGEKHPVASNQTAEGKKENRRVELIIHNGYSDGTKDWTPYYKRIGEE